MTGFLLVFQVTLGQGGGFGWWLRPLDCHLRLLFSVWSAGIGLGTASENATGAASVSRTVAGSTDGPGSACVVESCVVSITAGGLFVSADSAVLVSIISSGSNIEFGGSGARCTFSGS